MVRVPGRTARRAERTRERVLGGGDPLGGQQSGSEGGAEVGEGLVRRVARVVAEHRTHPGGVHAPAVGQELDLLRREVGEPHLPDRGPERRHGERRQLEAGPADAADRLREHDQPVTGDVERAVHAAQGRVLDRAEQVVLVEELEPGVEAEHGGDHRQPEVGHDRRVDQRPDHVRRAQHGHGHVGAPPGEAPHVGLDLRDVLGVAGARLPLRPHVLGEHRRVAVGGAVERGARLHDQVPQRRRLLAGSEELHRADDVLLLHRRPAAGVAGAGDHAHVDDGVDVLAGDHLGDHRVADVGPDEGDGADVATRGQYVDPHHVVDVGQRSELARHPSPEVHGDPGDQDDAAHRLARQRVTCPDDDAGRASS